MLRIAELLDIPLVHSLMAKGVVSDDHPLLLGMPGFWGLEFTNEYARSADLVLALGTRFAETDASSWERDYTWQFPPSRLVQIDLDTAEIGRNYPVAIGAVADVGLALAAIESSARPRRARRRSTAPELREQDRRDPRRDLFADTAGARCQTPPSRSRPERILARRAGRPPGGRRAGDRCRVEQERRRPAVPDDATPGASSPRAAPRPWASVRLRHSASSWRGPTVPSWLSSATAGMSAQLAALPTAVERGLPVIFVVMNNAAHGTIADLQASSYGASYGCEFLDPRRAAPTAPDFAALGRACGAEGSSRRRRR